MDDLLNCKATTVIVCELLMVTFLMESFVDFHISILEIVTYFIYLMALSVTKIIQHKLNK
jgi:hypothetical protein